MLFGLSDWCSCRSLVLEPDPEFSDQLACYLLSTWPRRCLFPFYGCTALQWEWCRRHTALHCSLHRSRARHAFLASVFNVCFLGRTSTTLTFMYVCWSGMGWQGALMNIIVLVLFVYNMECFVCIWPLRLCLTQAKVNVLGAQVVRNIYSFEPIIALGSIGNLL